MTGQTALTVYSLKNCDTCKKALAWLAARDVGYNLHDVRANGLTRADVAPIVDALGWNLAVNRRSTTWRGLDDDAKSDLDNQKAVALIVDNPTLLQRPVFVMGATTIAGFSPAVQDQLAELIKG